jgi:hypothetical protein
LYLPIIAIWLKRTTPSRGEHFNINRGAFDFLWFFVGLLHVEGRERERGREGRGGGSEREGERVDRVRQYDMTRLGIE